MAAHFSNQRMEAASLAARQGRDRSIEGSRRPDGCKATRGRSPGIGSASRAVMAGRPLLRSRAPVGVQNVGIRRTVDMLVYICIPLHVVPYACI